MGLGLLANYGVAWAQDATAPDPLQIIRNETMDLRATFGAGVNFVPERNLFWNYTRTLAPNAGYQTNKFWIEGYIQPGLALSLRINPSLTVYGQVSAILSGTTGRDAYDIGNTGRLTIEQAHLGLRYQLPDGLTSFDISAGRQDYRVGTGMLISSGASNGFERGALKLGPRKAWEMTVVGRLRHGPFSLEGFHLDPNERETVNQRNRVAGATIRYDQREGVFAGLSFAQVLRSDAPWIRAEIGAPPTILPGGRRGVKVLNAFARAEPFRDVLPGFFVSAEGALQWNERLDQRAFAGRVEIGRLFAEYAWRPMLWYAFQTFSGDDPRTARNERFDPLFYDGGLSAWATGSKSSMVFINSNIHAHQFALRLTPTSRDILTVRYAHIRANQLNSPVQFGQATRFSLDDGVPTLLPGVRKAHLADDIFVEYTRVITPNQFLTVGGSVSFPGAGIREVVNGRTSPWTGVFANYVVRY